MSNWGDNKVVGIIAAVIIAVSLSFAVYSAIKASTKFKKSTGEFVPAIPYSEQKK